ncbi:hypothetical protein AB0C29_26415 [Actinoplanes sp. NPDC048791]|uniref:hypothetical protein n=1 Tax=Actinoplanes sp. NPDC048791 TaxID=3154623 RepID=UPI0033E34057
MVTTAVLIRSTQPAGESVHRLAEFGSCREAERMAGRLSDAGFPVERVRIVGTGLRTEPATARPDKTGPHNAGPDNAGADRTGADRTGADTTGRHRIRAALLGAGLGAWLGLLTGLVLGLFIAGPAWLSVLLGGLLIGAFLGGLVGLLTHWAVDKRTDHAHWAVDKRTDHAGPSVIRAQRFAVEVHPAYAAEAVRALDPA